MMLLEEKINIAIENLAIRAICKNKYSLQTIADICELPLKHVKYLKRFSEHVTLKKIMNCSPEEAYVWKIIKTSAGMLEFEKLFKEQPPLTQKYGSWVKKVVDTFSFQLLQEKIQRQQLS